MRIRGGAPTGIGIAGAVIVGDTGTSSVQIGSATTTTTLEGGTRAVSVSKTGSFVADPHVSEYTLDDQCTVTLPSTAPNDTVWVGSGEADAFPHTFVPNGGLLINGTTSFTFDRRYGAQLVQRISGSWRAGL